MPLCLSSHPSHYRHQLSNNIKRHRVQEHYEPSSISAFAVLYCFLRSSRGASTLARSCGPWHEMFRNLQKESDERNMSADRRSFLSAMCLLSR
jgi:hypothetical protein